MRYQLACGFPICYVDDSVSGKVLNRCTNGRIYECQRDGNDRCHYEFLREATSEDDVRAGIEREADHRRAGECMRKILELGLRVRYVDYPESDKGTVYERHPDRKLYRIDFCRSMPAAGWWPAGWAPACRWPRASGPRGSRR